MNATNAPFTDRMPISIQARTIHVPLENSELHLASLLGLLNRGHVQWKTLRSEAALLQLGDATLACIPGEIYPEIVNGGVESPPGADFGIDPVEVPPLRELMPGKIRFIIGLANDELGYLIPKSQWDNEPPYLYNSSESVYGEITSVGPDTAGIVHQAIQELVRQRHQTPGK